MSSRTFKAAVIGGSGYGGGEIIRRLLRHPHVELARVASIDHVGQPLSAVHFNLDGLTDLRFEDLDAVDAARGMDVVFFGLPHQVSAEKVPAVLSATKAKIVDLSGAFRTHDAATYARWYGTEHPHPDDLGALVYGIPELFREQIRGARGVANPGCFATCVTLALAPLARRGWLKDAEVVAMTGSSGSGVSPSVGTHHPVRAGNLKSYKTLSHPQTPEMSETLGRLAGAEPLPLHFVPVSAPLTRGILATAFARVPAGVDGVAIAGAFEESFGAETFVRRPALRTPEVAAVAGSNYAEVGFVTGSSDERGTLVTALGALDNLIKGGAGQAVQNMNLLLDLDESIALDDPGQWP